METLQIKDKKFAVSIPESEILKQVKRVAGEINRDLAGTEPVFLAILNGSFYLCGRFDEGNQACCTDIVCQVGFLRGYVFNRFRL